MFSRFLIFRCIEGLARLYENDVVAYIHSFDVSVIVETFSSDFPRHLFPSHDIYIGSEVKVSHCYALSNSKMNF